MNDSYGIIHIEMACIGAKQGIFGEIPGKQARNAFGPNRGSSIQLNVQVIAATTSNLMAGGNFAVSRSTMAASFSRENDPKRLVRAFIMANLDKKGHWRFFCQ